MDANRKLTFVSTFALVFVAGAVSLGTIGIAQAQSRNTRTMPDMAQAQTASSTTFSCQTHAGVPTTMAHTHRGEVLPIIRWKYDGFRGWSPEQRCQEVSRRFQEYNQRGELVYLTTGWMNGQHVICTASYNRGPCRNLLLTVRPGVSPNRTLQDLFNLRDRSTGPITEIEGRLYLSMDEILEKARSSQPSNTGEPQKAEEETALESIW